MQAAVRQPTRGVDAFDLMKINGRWKIAGGLYTVETKGCEENPLGPIKPGDDSGSSTKPSKECVAH